MGKRGFKQPCPICDRVIKFDPENAIIFMYSRATRYSHVYLECPYCGSEVRFWDLTLKDFEHLAAGLHFEMVVESNAPTEIIKDWNEAHLHDYPRLEIHEVLTQHEERQIGFLRFLLQADNWEKELR